MGNPSKLTDHVVQRIEGRVQEIRERTKTRELETTDAGEDFNDEERGRPVVDAYGFVSEVADVPRKRVRAWFTRAGQELVKEERGIKLTNAQDLYARFGIAFDALRTASAERVANRVLDTALQSADKPAQIAAAKLVLPRIDPEGWGPQGQTVDVTIEQRRASVAIESLPQDVIDKLTPEMLDAISEHEQTIAEARASIDEIVASLVD